MEKKTKWLSYKYIREQAALSDESALNVSIEKWTMISLADPYEFAEAKRTYVVETDSAQCGLCIRSGAEHICCNLVPNVFDAEGREIKCMNGNTPCCNEWNDVDDKLCEFMLSVSSHEKDEVVQRLWCDVCECIDELLEVLEGLRGNVFTQVPEEFRTW